MTRELAERVLEKLGLGGFPANDLAGLEALYGLWCRNVPFDNLQKRLHLASGNPGPLPGNNSQQFFHDWLSYGTGGTCWSVSHALHDLLNALGFNAKRGTATMLTSPTVQGPNHGTVIVTLDDCSYLVDGSMLTERPLPLRDGSGNTKHPASQIPVKKRDGSWQFYWHPLHRLEGIWCRLDQVGVPSSSYEHYYESTRPWSPFNFFLYVRINTQAHIAGVVANKRISLTAEYQDHSQPMGDAERLRYLVEEMGIAEEVVIRQPPDESLPSPPVKT